MIVDLITQTFIQQNMRDGDWQRADWLRFLEWLHPNPDQAGREYQAIHQKLFHYFTKLGCGDAIALADQTIDRVIRLLATRREKFSSEPLRICYGVARFIYKEYLSQQVAKNGGEVTDAQPDPYSPATAQEQELIEYCLHRCLHKLDARKRDIYLRYYLSGTNRFQYAAELGMTINALRLLIMRSNNHLRDCITACQQQADTE